MPVSTKKKEYSAHVEMWAKTRNCVAGSKAVKDRGTDYLPKPDAEDKSAGNQARYKAYKERANFVNFTDPTLKGLHGMVFRDDVNIELSPDLEYLRQNANGSGLTLDQLTRRVINELIITGRVGMLVDYPEAPAGLTRAEVQARKLQANILLYPAESIINWRSATEGGITKISLVVLKERVEKVEEDGFGASMVTQYRVLRYEDGIYTQELWDENETLISVSTPRKANGMAWNEIPFIFAGSENNDDTIDKAPLYDIAEVNIAHYRNSADFEESCFMVGQPTPVFSGLTKAWVNDILKDGVRLGSRTGVLLPEGGSGDLLQANPNTMPAEGMESKELQLVKIGARIIEDQRGNETVDAARMRFAGQTSPLSVLVGNAEAAIKQCLIWAGWFMGADAMNDVFSINREFYDRQIDAQTIMANIQLLDRGVLAMSDLRNHLRASGVINNDRTDEEIDDEAEQVGIAPGI